MNICENCKHYDTVRVSWPTSYQGCTHSSSITGKADCVTGEVPRMHSSDMRDEDGPCGKEGKLYEKKKYHEEIFTFVIVAAIFLGIYFY